MIVLGYFLDALFNNVFIRINIIPCFSLVFSYLLYLKRKKKDFFFLEMGLSSFLAYLFFYKNFLFEFSYFIFFYIILEYITNKNKNKLEGIRNMFFLIIGYYLYKEIYLFFLQVPIPFVNLITDILLSLPLNLLIGFLLLNIIGINLKKVNKI